ncbi:MAG: hypothetical protein MUO21_07705 [Nitrososphaeraceae archaeon]|nr:hypothetical protein [Nitrososphaeraceae archaeon]
MACNNYEDCYKRELNNMEHPMDNESLYADRIYDRQTARDRCYSFNPIQIIEGFGASWNTIIKLLIVILLIYLVYELSKEFGGKKIETQAGGFINSPSPFNLSEYKP